MLFRLDIKERIVLFLIYPTTKDALKPAIIQVLDSAISNQNIKPVVIKYHTNLCLSFAWVIKYIQIGKQSDNIIAKMTGVSNDPVIRKCGLNEGRIFINCKNAIKISMTPNRRNVLKTLSGLVTKTFFCNIDLAHTNIIINMLIIAHFTHIISDMP